MNNKQTELVKSLLGEDFFQELEKFEILKPATNTMADPSEIRIALQIVPRTVLSFLFLHLKSKKPGEFAKIELPFANAWMEVNKLNYDTYSGIIYKEGKVVTEFKYRPLPSIGLILMSAFELYDVETIEKQVEFYPKQENKVNDLQRIIDERLSLQHLVSEVVERKISEREAINKLINERITQKVADVAIKIQEENKKAALEQSMELDVSATAPQDTPVLAMAENKKSKLKQFLDKKEAKRKENKVEINKNEIKCPDCKTALFKSGEKSLKLCVCYGDHNGKSVKFKKNEEGKVVFKFPAGFETENIEMLVDTLKEIKEV
jgi:hypothetical protein